MVVLRLAETAPVTIGYRLGSRISDHQLPLPG
jgi:hypothetical protein